MSLPPRTFFAGLASCLDDIAGELSGETDISSSSALRFLEAMVYCGTAKGSTKLTRGFGGGAQKNRFLLITQRGIPAPPRKMEDGGCGNAARQAYRVSAVGFGRFRTGEERSVVAAIKGRSLSAGVGHQSGLPTTS
jgi:hypothetical protein